jgi:hypothetical protein
LIILKKANKYNMIRYIAAQAFGRVCIAALLILPAIEGYAKPEDVLSDASLQHLEQRVGERWQAMVARDFEKVWEYSTPNYRSRFPKSLYPYNFSYALRWELTSIEVVNYASQESVASVAVRVVSVPTKRTSVASRAIGAVPVTIHEQWLYINSEWWYSSSH